MKREEAKIGMKVRMNNLEYRARYGRGSKGRPSKYGDKK